MVGYEFRALGVSFWGDEMQIRVHLRSRERKRLVVG